MFQRILAAVDSSPGRHSVLQLAAELARLAEAKVRVLHIAPSSAAMATVVSLEDDAEAKAILDDAVAALRNAGVDVEGTLANALTTQIATTISSAAEEWPADLVILNPHHRGALEALINPRVSDAVAHRSRVAVLLAPEDNSHDQR
ncbi:universal stress protein [Streptomyces viridiviolaceus]|uniref:Universal stress protein n=1 Tax=Streptomyces viridiviolaceus TaxID=68282 RepID=A0ABW2E4Q0_9ACTN|nr:universal stress protein [Streptomyces viridiviolaceus]GHB47074.1 universal stress protein [Streptomyces viridiviolaceus]